MATKSYHQTTHVAGQLEIFEKAAASQDQEILAYMRRHPPHLGRRHSWTAEDLHLVVLPNAPLTSVRRAMSNLYNAGLIEKQGEKLGKYGRPITKWRLTVIVSGRL